MKVFIVLLLVAAAVESITAVSLQDCSKPPITGPCRASIPRYYYDPKTDKCSKFIYGGCRGNKNNFKTEEECYEKCGATLSRKDCRKLPETGPCRARFIRYFYDPLTDRCGKFIYGGCGGNKNNFKTEEECYQKCGVQCEENAHYEDCGTACPLTCENYNNPPEFCPAVCLSGCQCDEGFVQTKSGRCVNPEDCPVTEICGENAQYESCGTLCPLTCGNYENPPQACAAVCVQGCQCKKGFVRTESGTCVKPEECPVAGNTTLSRKDCNKLPETGPCRARFIRYFYDPLTDRCGKFIYGGCGGNKNNFKTEEECYQKCGVQCEENAHYEDCGTACPLTCENYNNPPEFCPAVCQSGCQCDEGFVQTKSGRCVRPEDCPVTVQCEENAHYEDCGTACPLTCENYNNPPDFCPAVCRSGCQCDEGFVQTKSGRCVKPENCPVRGKCGKNAQYESCGTCERTCDNYAGPPQACAAVCVQGCRCKKGFVRNESGDCVTPEECPVTSNDCPPNKELGEFGDCPDSCYSLKHPVEFCTLRLNFGCKCKPGYVLKEDKVFDSDCIRPEECPLDE
ncbi:zonadhesin-like [Argiope bruennichi]|uniref:zonadhesin-like n=1 Tax=Argiope bruennichi TaxID=94029 RepID=UPI002494A6AD|nr:zonadhesin-like [Argiope bruennichi]